MKARILGPEYHKPEHLLALLASLSVDPACYFIADANELDGRELRVELAVPEFLDNWFGAVLICPPKPMALYKEEVVSDLVLLSE